MTDQEARSFGFDMRGPDVGVDWSGRNGFACTCEWSSAHHGDTCPEHGKRGVLIPSEVDELRAENERLSKSDAFLRALLAETKAEFDRLKTELNGCVDECNTQSSEADRAHHELAELRLENQRLKQDVADEKRQADGNFDSCSRIKESDSEARRVAGELATKLTEAIERMTRARMILTDGNPRIDCNWGMLDARDLSPALASYAKLTEAK